MPTFYYRFQAIGIDCTDEKEVKKYNRELLSVHDLSERFQELKSAYDHAKKERADIIVNVIPDLSGVAELSAYHCIRYKFLSRKVRKNCFSLCVTKCSPDGKMGLYFCETTDIREIERIFTDFVEKQSIPDLSDWKCVSAD